MAIKSPSTLQGVVTEPFFTATLPLPPGINASYGMGTGSGKNQFFSTVVLKQFKQEAGYLLSQQKIDNLNEAIFASVKTSKRKVPLTLTMDFYFKTLWKKDEDGGIKIVQDMVFKALGLNDNLVKRLIVEKHADRENPRCEISLSCWVEGM